MAALKLTEANFNKRMQLIGCCLGSQTENLFDSMSIGSACRGDIKKLEFFTILREILLCYTVDDNLTVDAQDLINCLSQSEILLIFERLSEYCDQCYPDLTEDTADLTGCTSC